MTRNVGAAVFTLAMVGVLVAVAAPAQVTVSTGKEKVVIDGTSVHVEDEEGTVTVSGDWRRGGVYTVADTDRILVELGAVETADRIQLNLAGDLLFPFDSAEIQRAVAKKLAQVAHVIRTRSVGRIYILGHTDSVGSAAYNLKLSRERVRAVQDWLARREGIPAAIMVADGVGSKHPVAHNTRPDGSDDPEGRARNRRVEIQIATREGVTLGPGTIVVEDDRVTVGDVSITEGSVTVGGIRIDTGGVAIGADRTGHAGRASGSGNCATLCKATAGKHSWGTIGCLEGTFEELGYDLDEDSCDELEDAMATGYGNRDGSLCLACQREEGFSDRDCATVAAKCFPSAR